ncbi:MAG: DNA-formamidopyrimidine glycosylase [Candidatus Magasanikbacteria bacterium CG10_big_fil_rev_8_21_14_0_10_36_32]|uniref:DNA-formamidopyrimidine glycosylase n=1 Tax=Candidatus Magasanikbacteria bacterium CG10_big_fil_rev_8_21_14_0_10_36_32 TaxID=1974646 RepID=A0A2M6W6K5_9BACT|nr:MAG: DNA-formamidopyrimidine glycosylase [Candidatus Magasanikbacteria bacterium CG10_big_fil_rev_8_21_14_0_10_36_32]
MPELPEVETIRSQLAKKITGKKITGIKILSSKTIKMPAKIFVKKIIGVKIKKIARRAKLLLFYLSNDLVLVTHLKMTGQYLWRGEKNKHTRVIFKFGLNDWLLFNDMRRFGYLKLLSVMELSKIMNTEYGPEPLDNKFIFKNFQEILNKRPKMKIKQLLLDQKLIAGLGNIYVQEACFASGIKPIRSAGSLKKNEAKKLYQAIKKVLSEAIKCGGSSAVNYLNLFGKEGNFVPRLKVYGHGGEKCRRCGNILKTIKLGGRGTVFCEVCQK